jgi:ABC-type transport system substrate-binding protein
MDMRKRRSTLPVLLLAAALTGVIVLAACVPSGNGGNGGNGENGYEPPPRPWIVKFGYEIDFVGANRLDPHGTVQPPLLGCYAEGLVARDQVTGEVQPGLATGWEVAPDWSYIDYFIREGVTFHNGDIMTAEDVRFSFERAMNPDINPVGYYYYTDLIDSLEIINDYQVRIHLKKPAQLLLEGSPAIVPKDYVEEVGDEEFGLNPVGTGPFRVVDWAGSDYVQLEPVEDHWRHTPNYDELMFKVVVESATMYAMLVTGELDIGVILPPLIPNVDANPDLTKVMSTPSTIRAIIFYDMARPGQPSPFLNPDVRKAVSLAIDRVGISENVLYGAYVPWGSYYAPYVLGYRDREPDPYDPDEARRLLAEAGYPDGFDTEFVFPTNYQIESEATIACLQEVGIRVEAKQMESLTWVTAHLLGTHSGIGFTFIPMWSGNRHPLISFAGEVGAFDPVGRTYEEILEAADNLLWATTEEEIIQAAWAAEDLVWSLNYKIPVFAVLGVYAYGPTIEWWQPRPGMEHSPGLEYIRFRE